MKLLFVVLILVPLVAGLAPLLQDDSATKVPGQYIVVLRSELTTADILAHIQQLQPQFAAGHGGILYGHYEIESFKGFGAKLSPELLLAQRSHPNVSYIEADQEVHISQTCTHQSSVLWNLDRVSERLLDLNGVYRFSQTGAGVDAYIVDTGIYVANNDFGGRATFDYAVDNRFEDGNGHGTHVASTVGGVKYGIAKEVHLYAVKVLDSSGSGTITGVIAGVNHVANQYRRRLNPSVANMSLGGGNSPTLVQAVENAITAGVTFAVAAGNDNANACNYSPANSPNAISVGATTSTDNRSSFSNWGTCVHISAPGSTVTAAWIGNVNAVNTISGTSMASPHVAGAAALVLAANPAFTPARVKAFLLDSSTSGVLKDLRGSPDRLLYSGC